MDEWVTARPFFYTQLLTNIKTLHFCTERVRKIAQKALICAKRIAFIENY